MLRECSSNEFDKYIDFIYDLATDLTKSGYPTYCDGIKTREMFIERSSKAFTRDTEQILLFEYDGVVQGWIHYYWISEDNYLSTCSFNINIAMRQALKEFIEFAYERFRGYDLYFGFPAANKDAIEYLSGHGFECIEEDYNNVAFPETFDITQKVQSMVRIICRSRIGSTSKRDLRQNLCRGSGCGDRICNR